MSDIDPDMGLYETLKEMRDETTEGGLMLLFNYAVAVDTPDGESNDLSGAMKLLQENGLIEEED